MSRDNLIQAIIPLVAVIVGGLLTVSGSYFLQLHTEQQRRDELIRTKLEMAIAIGAEIALGRHCMLQESEKGHYPLHCIVPLEKLMNLLVIVNLFEQDLTDSADASVESFYEISDYIERQKGDGGVVTWDETRQKELESMLVEFDGHFDPFMDALTENARDRL